MCDHPYVPWCYHSQMSIEFHTVLSRRRCDSTTFYRRTSAIANEITADVRTKTALRRSEFFSPDSTAVPSDDDAMIK